MTTEVNVSRRKALMAGVGAVGGAVLGTAARDA